MSLGDKIAASKDAWERKPQDEYPTPPDFTQALLDRMGWNAAHGLHLNILEPCCGEGQLAEVLVENGHAVTAFDIRHTGYGTPNTDYLSLPDESPDYYQYDAVITNPPFSHAEEFIRRALLDAPIVAMLLPSGYWHAYSRSKLFETRPPSAILCPTWRPAFLEAERGKSPLMNCIWTVWVDTESYSRVFRADVTTFHLIHRPKVFPAIREPNAAILAARALNAAMQPLEKALTGLIEALG